jgi:hypothetical protein
MNANLFKDSRELRKTGRFERVTPIQATIMPYYEALNSK